MPSDIDFYLDSNIILAYYFKDDDANQHNRILKCLNKISSKNNISLIASSWTMIEADNAIAKKITAKVNDKELNNRKADYKRKKAKKFIARLWLESKLDNVNFKIRRFGEKRTDNYFLSLEDFFDLVDEVVPLGNLRDALHCIIMNHFKIKKILTFNVSDFKIFEEEMEDIEVISPDDIDKHIGNK